MRTSLPAFTILILVVVEAVVSFWTVCLLYAVGSNIAVASGNLVLLSFCLSIGTFLYFVASSDSFQTRRRAHPLARSRVRSRAYVRSRERSRSANVNLDDDNVECDVEFSGRGEGTYDYVREEHGSGFGFVVLCLVGVLSLGIAIGMTTIGSTLITRGQKQQDAFARTCVLVHVVWFAKVASIVVQHRVIFVLKKSR